jgi:hypothetical protein
LIDLWPDWQRRARSGTVLTDRTLPAKRFATAATRRHSAITPARPLDPPRLESMLGALASGARPR